MRPTTQEEQQLLDTVGQHLHEAEEARAAAEREVTRLRAENDRLRASLGAAHDSAEKMARALVDAARGPR